MEFTEQGRAFSRREPPYADRDAAKEFYTIHRELGHSALDIRIALCNASGSLNEARMLLLEERTSHALHA